MNKNSYSEHYAASGVDITAGYKAVELMKQHVARTVAEGVLGDVGGFGVTVAVTVFVHFFRPSLILESKRLLSAASGTRVGYSPSKQAWQ